MHGISLKVPARTYALRTSRRTCYVPSLVDRAYKHESCIVRAASLHVYTLVGVQDAKLMKLPELRGYRFPRRFEQHFCPVEI